MVQVFECTKRRPQAKEYVNHPDNKLFVWAIGECVKLQPALSIPKSAKQSWPVVCGSTAQALARTHGMGTEVSGFRTSPSLNRSRSPCVARRRVAGAPHSRQPFKVCQSGILLDLLKGAVDSGRFVQHKIELKVII